MGYIVIVLLCAGCGSVLPYLETDTIQKLRKEVAMATNLELALHTLRTFVEEKEEKFLARTLIPVEASYLVEAVMDLEEVAEAMRQLALRRRERILTPPLQVVWKWFKLTETFNKLFGGEADETAEFLAEKAAEFLNCRTLKKDDRKKLAELLRRIVSEISPHFQFERAVYLKLGEGESFAA
jgi:hypothetical protein